MYNCLDISMRHEPLPYIGTFRNRFRCRPIFRSRSYFVKTRLQWIMVLEWDAQCLNIKLRLALSIGVCLFGDLANLTVADKEVYELAINWVY